MPSEETARALTLLYGILDDSDQLGLSRVARLRIVAALGELESTAATPSAIGPTPAHPAGRQVRVETGPLDERKSAFLSRTAQFASAGYDRLGAPEYILDVAGELRSPVLDVGTGTGITARALAARGLDVVSVDLSAEDQEVAALLTDDPELQRHIRYQLGDASSLPVPDDHFGGAVLIDVLHHVDSGEPLLKEVRRVVDPGGLVVLADFTPEGFRMVSRVYGADGLTHEQGPVTVDWARGFLTALGLTQVTGTDGHFHQVAVFRNPGPD
jgi:ubiquinone/menaquinone biosynthesis C-methylase UbiE